MINQTYINFQRNGVTLLLCKKTKKQKNKKNIPLPTYLNQRASLAELARAVPQGSLKHKSRWTRRLHLFQY